jgi:hypothetical protein
MTTRTTFLAAVLPPLEKGEHYCSWGIKQGQIRQHFVTSIEELIEHCDVLNTDGYNSFYALAKFGPKEQGRYAANAVALKSFFLDLDCGEGKPYPTLGDGLAALRTFCKATNMPKPTIVQSGRGAHVYWVLKEALPKADWKRHAEELKKLCTENKFDIDYAVPADAARVLRMVGTNHLKDPTNPIPVEVLHEAALVPLERVKDILSSPLSVLDQHTGPRQYDPLTLALMGTSESHFKTLLTKSLNGNGCAQITHIVTEQATVSEPLWRAGLSIAQCCTDRDKAIHGISKLHPDYDPTVTERKATETKGPYTCETFKKLNPSLCEGCTLKITSPIQLGRKVVEATEEESVVTDLQNVVGDIKEAKTYIIPKYPFPFFRGKTGGVFVHTKNKEGEDTEEAVYPYDFYVVKRMHDPDLGETILVRLHLPQDGVREFIMPLSHVLSKEKFVNTISYHGVTALGKKQETLMYYVAKWVEELQSSGKAEKSHKQFGWVEDDSAIIIGDREIRAIDVVYSPPSGPTLPHVPLFQAKGDFHVWKDVINAYAKPGREARAFAFFMGFGSLLMKFTALDGFLLNLVSRESGSGKTTILHAINSIYGRPKELLLAPKDTYNSRMQRLGTMQNLAVTMDEVTNMPPEQMSQQVYDVTSGRAKNRLRQHENAERANNTKWATGMITSSNRYIVDALLSIKGFPDGELKRIMEINIKPEDDDATWARQHFGRLMNNYGHAIEPFAQAVVGQLPMVKAKLSEIQLRVDNAAEIRNSERYWAAMASLAMAGGAISKQIGLHDIPLKPVFNFGIDLIKDTRSRTVASMFDTEDFLGGFLQKHFHEILIINGNNDRRTGMEQAAIREPRGVLTARFEPDTKLLFIVAKTFREDCAKAMLNFEEVIAPHKRDRALLGVRRKRMTAGTVANMQAPVSAMVFDTAKLSFFDGAALVEHAKDDSGEFDPTN